MIFCKTTEEKAQIEQIKIKRLIMGVRKFAFIPRQLFDDSYVWLQFYYEYHQGEQKKHMPEGTLGLNYGYFGQPIIYRLVDNQNIKGEE